MKKIIFFILFFGLLSSLYWFFFYQETYRNPFASVQPIEAIPQNTPIILEFEDYYMMRHAIAKMPYTDDMGGAFFVKKLSEDFKYIRQLLFKNKNHRQLLLDSPITAALHLSGKADVDFLYVIEDKKRVFQLQELLKNFKNRKSTSNQNVVYQLEMDVEEKYTIASYKDLLLISKYAYLVESAMMQLKSPETNLLDDPRLDFSKKGKRTENQVEVTVLFENLKAFANPFLLKKAHKYLTYFSKYISSGHWILDFEKEGIRVNGCLKIENENSVINDLFLTNINTNSKATDFLPRNIAYFFRHSLKEIKNIKSSERTGDQFFKKYFSSWIGEEWLVGRTEVFTRRMNAEKFVAYNIKNDKLKTAQHYLQKMTDSLGLRNEWNYQTYSIRQFESQNLPIPFTSNENLIMEKPCYTFIGDYVVFAGARRILENWIDQYLTNQTIASHIPYLKMKGQAGKNEIAEFYWSTQMSNQFLKNSFDTREKGTVTQIELFERFPSFGLNISKLNDEFLTNGFLYYEKESIEKTKVKWRTPIEAKAITQPYPIFNNERGAYDILIQDENHRLYSLNQDGEIVWDTLLDSPIQSEIFAADFSENSSSLILFNTKDKIYLMDNEGNHQNEFPLELNSPASNGLALADFGDKEYGIFIACENHLMYGFDKNGIPISGWNSLEGAGEVKESIKHFQVEKEDYLVVINTNGDIFSYKKDGFIAMEIFNIINESSSSLCFQIAELKNQMAIGDKNGNTSILNLGESNLNFSRKEIPQQYIYKYASADFGGNNNIDYVQLKNNELEIFYYHNDGFEKYGDYQFSILQDAIFPVQSKNMGKSMLGSICKKQNQIFLLNKKGNLHPDFPLAGSTEFELVNLFSENKNTVLVADGEQVVAYELP